MREGYCTGRVQLGYNKGKRVEADFDQKGFSKQTGVYERYAHLWFFMDGFYTGDPLSNFLATSYKENGQPNACLQSWSIFVGDDNNFYAVLSAVNKSGHLYKTMKTNGAVTLNFLSADIYPLCVKTIENNAYEDDKITKSGLTAQKAAVVDAPV